MKLYLIILLINIPIILFSSDIDSNSLNNRVWKLTNAQKPLSVEELDSLVLIDIMFSNDSLRYWPTVKVYKGRFYLKSYIVQKREPNGVFVEYSQVEYDITYYPDYIQICSDDNRKCYKYKLFTPDSKTIVLIKI